MKEGKKEKKRERMKGFLTFITCKTPCSGYKQEVDSNYFWKIPFREREKKLVPCKL